ncbi:MAG: low molecular weight phosphatase family protein [Actinomycetota bacterium]|nr:low molecular weight phosphatase family protein [Actinomycetota bacterium]
MTLRVLIVCTANVCRSPMAEGLLRRQCEQLAVDISISSAGTHVPGLPVDPLAVVAVGELGVDISAHRSRQLTRTVIDADGADLVLTMTREQLRHAATSTQGAFRRTFTLREFSRWAAQQPPEPGDTLGSWLDLVATTRHARDLMGDDPADDVADAYGLSLEAHRRCADILDRLAGTVARSLAVFSPVR